MARLRIDLPEKFVFSTEIPIYIQHINYGRHLDNAALLMLVAEARVRLFKHFGWTELDVGGPGIVVADVAAQYRSEAFHGETLRAEFAAADFNDYGCDLLWRLSDLATGREVARGKHGLVFFDYASRSKARVPAIFVAKVGGA
ncbi:MAG: thioesterase family protein [Dechloromonas sp.]|nr:thioesterase family protein [Dechloromonas sp.]